MTVGRAEDFLDELKKANVGHTPGEKWKSVCDDRQGKTVDSINDLIRAI